MVVGVFDDYTTAQRAADDLVSNGFSRENIDVRANERFADVATGNTALTGQDPKDTSGGGIAGFFRRLLGNDEEYSSHYEEAIRRGGAVVCVDTDDHDRAAEILDQNGAVDIDERAASWREQGYTDSSTVERDEYERSGTGDRTMPVVREELEVGKREVLRGGVRVYNRVEEQPVEEQVRLREEHVRVDRRPANRPATEADLRAHDEVIEVTERAEVPVVNKTARVVEEVVVGKETTQRTENIRDTVRRTDVNVERIGAEGSALTDYDEDFRRDFQSRYGSLRGAKYEIYAPAYQYGYRMAFDDRYRDRQWDEVESDLRYDYERNYPANKWEKMKDSIRYGWEKVTGRR
jgi:uncharacterized protein (TIGR02271 family)